MTIGRPWVCTVMKARFSRSDSGQLAYGDLDSVCS